MHSNVLAGAPCHQGHWFPSSAVRYGTRRHVRCLLLASLYAGAASVWARSSGRRPLLCEVRRAGGIMVKAYVSTTVFTARSEAAERLPAYGASVSCEWCSVWLLHIFWRIRRGVRARGVPGWTASSGPPGCRNRRRARKWMRQKLQPRIFPVDMRACRGISDRVHVVNCVVWLAAHTDGIPELQQVLRAGQSMDCRRTRSGQRHVGQGGEFGT